MPVILPCHSVVWLKNKKLLKQGGLLRPVCWYVFVDPFVQIGFAVSDDFSQFDKRQAVFVRHTPDGKRVDFHADINGGVPRCHQSGGGYVAGFFTGSFHVFLLSLTKAWTHRNTGAHVLHQINDVGFDWIVCRLGKYRSVLKSCYQSKHINTPFAISPVYDCDWLSLPDGKKRKYGLRFLRFWLMMNEEDWWHLNGVGVDRRLTGVFPKAL